MIDWKRVEDLRAEIGADSFAEVADMFLEEAEQAVRALTEGLPVDEIEGQLHFLKGSALNLGLADLASICQDGERKAAAGYGALVDLTKVARTYQASRALLLAGLAGDAAATGTAA
jgi:HPt (histidine-containing phosphotransfer) domain-containing protein